MQKYVIWLFSNVLFTYGRLNKMIIILARIQQKNGRMGISHEHPIRNTVTFFCIVTPEIIAIIILKFDQGDFSIGQSVQKM